jgi:predicted phage terminase large subunit-like protein
MIYSYKDGVEYTAEELAKLSLPFAHKLTWFLERGYKPHYWQLLYHCSSARFRHLAAGRRSGKTMAAAWEIAYYALNPEQFHKDFYNKDSNEPLMFWVLTKDHVLGLASRLMLRHVLKEAATYDVDYVENKTNKWFEFTNGTMILFKTAEDPETLRGHGIHLLWIDEAAIIPTRRPWEVTSPGLTDKLGIVITTTTSGGNNWYYQEFIKGKEKNEDTLIIEMRSIDNPYYSKQEWIRMKNEMHPLLFQIEMCAAFEAEFGKDFAAEWLSYYEPEEIQDKDLEKFIGVDPAISTTRSADRFVISLIGVDRKTGTVYLLEQEADKIPFPDQVEKIEEWNLKYRPSLIGIERNAYQAALVQQLQQSRTFPPIQPILTLGKKSDRLMAMSPLFRSGRVKILKSHVDFISEWLNYDGTVKNNQDDCLDSVEIALRTAGVILPAEPETQVESLFQQKGLSELEIIALKQRPGSPYYEKEETYDEHLGIDW